MKKFLLLSFLLLMGLSLQAQSIDSLKLNTYFQKLDSTNRHMISAAVWKDKKVIYTNQTGFSDVENKIKATKDTKYRIGSISKTFTATLILKAIEEGKINLNTKLKDYYPQIANASIISIDDMLSHKSGLFNFTSDSLYLTYYQTPTSKKEILKILSQYKPLFKPESKHSYSNTNYLLLSYVLEDLYHKPYKQILYEKIIKPLGLTHTYFGGKINPSQNEAFSYIQTGKEWVKLPETDTSIPMGAGGIVSTPSDLLLFADALFNQKLLKKESLKLMLSGDSTTYKKGLFVMPFNFKKGFGHTGGIDGFTSVFVYFPKDKIGAAITSNGSNMNNNEILILLLKAAFNEDFKIPDFKTYPITKEELNKYIGVYSTKKLPLKISISTEGNSLKAQATGQSAFILEAKTKTLFVFTPAGIELEFIPEKNQMILKQAGQKFILTKE